MEFGNTILKSAQENIVNVSGTVISRGYNLSSDSNSSIFTGARDQTDTDPMLGPLKDNGGPTLTHAPLINSPAIDQGKRDAIPALATNFDQRGLVRPINDPTIPKPNGGDGSDIGAVELAVGPHPASAGSWKTHGEAGSFAIGLPLVGPVGVECRSGGANDDFKVVVTFAQPIGFSSAEIISGIGMVSNVTAITGTDGVAGTQITIDLTGVIDAQRITIALFDVDDGTKHADVGIRMGILSGDTSGNETVNSSDIILVKSQSGQAVGPENFRADVVANGVINATDVGAVKLRSGTGLP